MEFAFRSYTKEENNQQFNSVKAIATDKSNIAFRTQMQSGCLSAKEETEKPKPAVNFDHIRRDLGMKPDAQQQKRKSDDELKQEYRAPYPSAVKSLFSQISGTRSVRGWGKGNWRRSSPLDLDK